MQADIQPTAIPLTVVTIKRGESVQLNRFFNTNTRITPDKTVAGVLQELNCTVYGKRSIEHVSDETPTWKHPQFQLIRFEYEGSTQADVAKFFTNNGLRPATLLEQLMFTLKYHSELAPLQPSILALGSSDHEHLKDVWNSQPWWKRAWKKFRRYPESRTQSSYPMIEPRTYGTSLRLTEGGGRGWKSHCMFLAVITQPFTPEDRKLVGLNMTVEEYLQLPDGLTMTDQEVRDQMVGFKFKAKNGHVCEVVRGADMFNHQWASLCVPEFGLRHYLPLFAE